MKQEIPYSKTSDSIIGYSDSKIAKIESNDCVVRSLASAFDMSYDTSHEFVFRKFGRKTRKGTSLFTMKMDWMSQSGEKINNKTFKLLSLDGLKSKLGKSRVSFNQFFKHYQTGTYVLVVRGHAFTLKNGIVIGNDSDAKRLRAIIYKAYQVN
jgi:hypothetical protein